MPTSPSSNQHSLLTEAHTWIGLVISSVLFIVFFAGSLSFYRLDIKQWEAAPHTSAGASSSASIDAIFKQALAQLGDAQLHHEHGMTLQLPSDDSPSIWLGYETEIMDDSLGQDEHPETQRHSAYFDAAGQKLGDDDPFMLDQFIFGLHYWLHLPYGKYFVGLVTLFYFVALLTGICIHWRKLIPNFFLYRRDKKRTQWLDSHNLIGVMTLPYHLMYAITGLIFNLVIIFQIAYVALIYSGDRQALFDEAGFNFVSESASGTPMTLDGIDDLVIRANSEFPDFNAEYVTLYFPGHDNAIVEVLGEEGGGLSNRSQVRYRLKDGDKIYRSSMSENSAVSQGLQVIHQLHYGHFGTDAVASLVKFLFFLMGLGGCYLIISGNLLWLNKRAAKRRHSVLGIHLVRAISNGFFIGTLAATGAAFISARLLPLEFSERSFWIATSFGLTLLGCTAYALTSPRYISVMRHLLTLSASLWLTIIGIDWFGFSDALLNSVANGSLGPLWIQCLLLCGALLFLHLAKRAGKRQQKTAILVPESRVQ